MDVFIKLTNVCRSYTSEGEEPVHALRDATFGIEKGAFVAITGESGCGKSTLLHLLGALDMPTSGEIYVADKALHTMSEVDRTRYRREDVGIVFQFFNLLPTLTVTENVSLPLQLQAKSQPQAIEAAERAMELTGITHRSTHFPHQLSGGEMQRTAIARALVHSPGLLLADEPTGNLDRGNAENILELLKDLHDRQVATLVVVTHSDEVAAAAGEIRNMDAE
jgi:ABC-type lipoprotein export system ATPase subunit